MQVHGLLVSVLVAAISIHAVGCVEPHHIETRSVERPAISTDEAIDMPLDDRDVTSLARRLDLIAKEEKRSLHRFLWRATAATEDSVRGRSWQHVNAVLAALGSTGTKEEETRLRKRTRAVVRRRLVETFTNAFGLEHDVTVHLVCVADEDGEFEVESACIGVLVADIDLETLESKCPPLGIAVTFLSNPLVKSRSLKNVDWFEVRWIHDFRVGSTRRGPARGGVECSVKFTDPMLLQMSRATMRAFSYLGGLGQQRKQEWPPPRDAIGPFHPTRRGFSSNWIPVRPPLQQRR
jgi:hypothetical protein